ncbi:MAG: hypothetical protein H0X45_02615 [Planctomycetes bacterium]|nr:hypothetical protein [Planctomycetota bacterium]
MSRFAPLLLAVAGLGLTLWSLSIRIQLSALDGRGAAWLRRVGVALSGRGGEVSDWSERAVAAAIVGPALTLVALVWWRARRPAKAEPAPSAKKKKKKKKKVGGKSTKRRS